jgi:uncharacterized membrane protein
MDEPYKKSRVDYFQRILISFFFSEVISDKERKRVVWTVRLATVAAALIFAMLITLVTESILSFFSFIIVFVIWYVILRISGMLRKRHHVNE